MVIFSSIGSESNLGRRESEDIFSGWSDNDGVTFVRHLPLIYPRQLIKSMPKRMSFMIIFSSGPNVGCVIFAPNRVVKEIDSSGLVQDMIAQL
jgi:hypothetical protein